MQIIKKNTSFILGISLPILMILILIGSIYLPGFFIKPHFNFLYTVNDNYYNNNQIQYSIQNNKLIKGDSGLYLHDVVNNKSQEIPYEEAQNLNLDSSKKSPDNFEIVYGSRKNGFFPFFYTPQNDYNIQYLKGHGISKKLNLQLNGNSYNNKFRFLGWIK